MFTEFCPCLLGTSMDMKIKTSKIEFWFPQTCWPLEHIKIVRTCKQSVLRVSWGTCTALVFLPSSWIYGRRKFQPPKKAKMKLPGRILPIWHFQPLQGMIPWCLLLGGPLLESALILWKYEMQFLPLAFADIYLLHASSASVAWGGNCPV